MNKQSEKTFRSKLQKKITKLFPDCMILPLDPKHTQGIPDILILYKNKWATLETKKSSNASKRPNQYYYVDKMNNMSFSSFINPDNEEEVLNELQQAFDI